MSFKFAANVTMMFKEAGKTANRILRAKEFGFKYVEITMPYGEKDEIKETLDKTGVECTLINICPGPGGKLITLLPEKKNEFKDTVKVGIEHAKAFSCKRMHVLAGILEDKTKQDVAEKTYIENLRVAAELAEKEGITIMVEAVNSILTLPGYFVDTPDKALDLIKKIDRPNVKFQMDIFHFQLCLGNLTKNIEKYSPFTEYIQISQAPNRSEPGTSGEIEYRYIFEVLNRLKYTGFIGLEYMPMGDTVEGLKWVKEFNLTL